MFQLINLTKLTSSYRSKLIIRVFHRWLKDREKILDVGCGNGIVTKLLISQIGIKATGCDIRNYLIYDDIPFVRIKNNKLPFSKKKFDALLLIDVLHHLPFEKQENLIQESLRVANKVLIFEAKPTIAGKLADIILNKYHYGNLKTPLSFRDINNWKILFKKLSLKYRTATLDKPFWYPFSHIAFVIQKV